jgi:hypothetical protein
VRLKSKAAILYTALLDEPAVAPARFCVSAVSSSGADKEQYLAETALVLTILRKIARAEVAIDGAVRAKDRAGSGDTIAGFADTRSQLACGGKMRQK